MQKLLNSRRRFLGLLALLGAPGLARAQTATDETATYDVVCSEQLARKPGLGVAYYRHFYLEGGKLSPSLFDDYNTIIVTPSGRQFSPGFSDAAKPSSDDVPVDAIQFKVMAPTSDGCKATFSASLRFPATTTDVGATLLTTAGQVNATGGSAIPTSADPTVVNIIADWQPAPKEILSGPVQIGISYNGTIQAIFDFDVSTTGAVALIQARDDELQAKSGLELDFVSNKVIGAETCEYNPNAADDVTCFFTTAAVGTLGLSDDCWELRTLRAFRDGALSRTAEGRALTARYYNEAPRIVAGISARSDAGKVWLAHYWTHILPCAVMARLGLTQMAVAHYTRLFARLERLAVW